MPGLNLGVPRAVGNGSLPTPVPGRATYIDGQLSPALSDGFGPQILLDNLPATLQPGSTLFYYNPEEENLLLQQAALKQTGKASFIDGLAPDSKQNLSAAQVEKAHWPPGTDAYLEWLSGFKTEQYKAARAA